MLGAADGLVLPGVGAFPAAMRNLRELGLERRCASAAPRGTPLLGICLGMQLLFERSEELEPTAGLGLIAGRGHAAATRAGCGSRTSAGTRCASSARRR